MSLVLGGLGEGEKEVTDTKMESLQLAFVGAVD